MNLSLFIARRYFFSGKKKTFITFISIIAMVVVGTSAFALVLVLSVFNGLEGLLRNIYGSFDPDIVIQAEMGKSFEYSEALKDRIISLEEVASVTEVIEDNVLLKYRGAQRVVRMKGVGDDFLAQNRFENSLTYGPMILKDDSTRWAIIGRGIQYNLGINLEDEFMPLQVFYPRDVGPGQINPERMFNQRPIPPGSVFAIEKYYDENYFFVPVEFAADLLQYGNKVTSLEIVISPRASATEVKKLLSDRLGNGLTVKTNSEIHASLYRILQWEKIFVFLTFGVILVIGSINIYFALSMLVLDKKKDLAILRAMGASARLVRATFLSEGAMIAFSGAALGLGIGLAVAWLQQTYGLVKMGVPGAISDAYPVKIERLDILITVLLVIFITILSSVHPALKASKLSDLHLLQ